MSTRLQRSSISPFRSRKAPLVPGPKTGAGQTTPSAGSGRPTTPSHSSTSRPTTPSSSASLAAPARGPTTSKVSPVSSVTSFFSHPATEQPEFHKCKENVTVTVRFRPLSPREINKGDEIAWYADGDFAIGNEYNLSVAYGFDRVFGPATTTRHVYDVAAQHVVSGAMQGINGTVFAYGVTSSGKTHTMHVINDLLDPAGQNLRIREDSQFAASLSIILSQGLKKMEGLAFFVFIRAWGILGRIPVYHFRILLFEGAHNDM